MPADDPRRSSRWIALSASFYRYDILAYLIYGLALLIFAFPVYWVISLSLRTQADVITTPIKLLPPEITFQAYQTVFEQSEMPRWIWNSLKVTILEVVGIVLVVVPSAYGFSRFDFRGKRPLLIGVLMFQMISPVVIVIPLYNLMDQLRLLDTHIGLIFLYIGLQVPFSVWLLKSFFDTIPTDLDEAARVDGCNRLQTLRYVLLPSVIPGIVVVVIFNFISSWGEFVMAYTVLSDSTLFTAAIGIYSFQGPYGARWAIISAASVIVILPVLTMFIFLQRYFIRGLVEGGVKG